jgi:hypothetical protein
LPWCVIFNFQAAFQRDVVVADACAAADIGETYGRSCNDLFLRSRATSATARQHNGARLHIHNW